MTGRWKTVLSNRCGILPPLNFISMHYIYFVSMGFVWSIVLWGASNPFQSVSYTDSLFLSVSAMTGAGLNTINLSTLTTFQQTILFGLIILGHPILISCTVLLVRKRAFETKFKSVTEEYSHRGLPFCRRLLFSFAKSQRKNHKDGYILESGNSAVTSSVAGQMEAPKGSVGEEMTCSPPVSGRNCQDTDDIRWANDGQVTINPSIQEMTRHPLFQMTGLGANSRVSQPKIATPHLGDRRPASMTSSSIKHTKYSSSKHPICRNSQFYGLTAAEREKLGGIEYKAVVFLSIVVPLYYILFNVLGSISLGAWLAVHSPGVARENGLSPFWTGAFFGVSAFANNGMSLLDLNMTALQTSTYMMLTMGFLILAGNTLYPCFLRFMIWTMTCILPKTKWFDDWKAVLNFILDHPRRVYTHLFPRRHTWYLLCAVILLNSIDWAGFEILSVGNQTIENLGAYRILDGLFQAFAVRSGGFYVVDIAGLHQGLLVLYVLMMYISAFPVLVTIRNTNVYEERSLGIYATDNLASDDGLRFHRPCFYDYVKRLFSRALTVEENHDSRSYFVRQQLRSQLSHDIWCICLAVLLISIVEASSYASDPVAYSTFNIIFETVSAYGCVGISVGLPDQNFSFCGGWHTISKLILIVVMLRGRHRGLPVAIDKAVMLPNESLSCIEEEDAAVRLGRSKSWAAAT